MVERQKELPETVLGDGIQQCVVSAGLYSEHHLN